MGAANKGKEPQWLPVREAREGDRLQNLQRLLKENGIESYLMDATDSVYPPLGRYRLYVKEEDLAVARGLIESL